MLALLGDVGRVQNIIVPAWDEASQWVQQVTEKIGPWRARIRSAYIQWAMAVNGLHTAHAHLALQDTAFVVHALRPGPGGLQPAIVASYPSPEAAVHHLAAQTKLAAWGIADLYSAFEAFVFEVYADYLRSNPDKLLAGDLYKDLRRLRRKAAEDPALETEWRTQLQGRIDAWASRRSWNALGSTLKQFFADAALKPPSYFKTGPESWAETLGLFALLRHALVHGDEVVGPQLAAASEVPHNAGIRFEAGKQLAVGFFHLQAMELYAEQLLTAINLSLVELARREYVADRGK